MRCISGTVNALRLGSLRIDFSKAEGRPDTRRADDAGGAAWGEKNKNYKEGGERR